MSGISPWYSKMVSGGTYLFLYHPILDTIDNFITNVDEITIMFIVPKPHEFPGLQLFVPTTLDDPFIVLFSRSFPPGIVPIKSAVKT